MSEHLAGSKQLAGSEHLAGLWQGAAVQARLQSLRLHFAQVNYFYRRSHWLRHGPLHWPTSQTRTSASLRPLALRAMLHSSPLAVSSKGNWLRGQPDLGFGGKVWGTRTAWVRKVWSAHTVFGGKVWGIHPGWGLKVWSAHTANRGKVWSPHRPACNPWSDNVTVAAVAIAAAVGAAAAIANRHGSSRNAPLPTHPLPSTGQHRLRSRRSRRSRQWR